MTLKPYMGYSSEPEEGACLIFAHTAKEAKKIGWFVVSGWWSGAEYIDMRANLIKGEDHLFKEADQEKLKADVAHVIESPKTCRYCDRWGNGEIGEDGLCHDCHLERERAALALEKEVEADKQAVEYMASLPLPETHPDDALMSLPYDLR